MAVSVAAPARPHLAEQLPEQIGRILESQGLPVRPDEARRVLAHAISPTAAGNAARRPLSRRVQQAVAELFDTEPLEVLERAADPADGFVKYLFRHRDGMLSEAVRIPLHEPGSYTVCLSSQVGCAMGCAFCATAGIGLRRNLEAWEMVSAFLTVRDEAPGRVGGAVFMGQGEPFHNYEAVMRAAAVLSHPCGARVSGDAISVSTVGLPDRIRRFAQERRPHRLIVSLTSAIPEKRAELLPVAGRVPLEELADAVREYAAASHSRVTIAWVLMAGVNTGPEEARALGRLFGGVPLRISLIDVNATEHSPRRFRRAADAERQAFIDHLQALRVPVVRRYSGRAASRLACGTLASARLASERTT